jgi:hypothetical protein
MNNLQTVSKALAGALVTALVAFLVKHGVILDPSVSEAITVLIAALIGFVVVYISPRNK